MKFLKKTVFLIFIFCSSCSFRNSGEYLQDEFAEYSIDAHIQYIANDLSKKGPEMEIDYYNWIDSLIRFSLEYDHIDYTAHQIYKNGYMPIFTTALEHMKKRKTTKRVGPENISIPSFNEKTIDVLYEALKKYQ